MTKFAIGEYIRNIGYHVVTVLMLVVTFIVSTIFLSNIDAQTRTYRLIKPYLNENSIIIADKQYNFDVTTLTKYEKSLDAKEILGTCDEIDNFRSLLIYDEASMDNYAPRLQEGKYIDKVDAPDDVVKILLSSTYEGINVGDIITIHGTLGEEPYDIVSFKALVTGIISEGQKVLSGNGASINAGMNYDDIFVTYSLEQQGRAIAITTEEEYSKLGLNFYTFTYRSIVKFDDSITSEERTENLNKVIEAEIENGNYPAGTDIFPASSTLVKRMETTISNTLAKYVPLTIAVIILIMVCVMGMTSIKTANSMRYFATLYICGMPYKKAVLTTGIEMVINCIISLLIGCGLITLQNRLSIVGVINCRLDVLQILVMFGICVVIVAISMLMTRIIIKERSPMNILKDTTY